MTVEELKEKNPTFIGQQKEYFNKQPRIPFIDRYEIGLDGAVAKHRLMN